MATSRMPRTDSVSKQRSKSKGLSQYSTKPPKDPDFEMLKLSKIGATHGVVIAVDEVSSSTLALSAPPRAVLPRKQTPDPRPKQNPARASIDDVQGSKSQRTTTSRIAPLQSQSRPSSPVRGEASMHSQSSSTTLVRSDSNSSSTPRTPVMRSIFPRYNPSLPLAKQQYYPSVDRSLGPIIATNEASRSSAFSMSVYSQNEKSTPQLKPAMEGSSTSLAHEHTSPLQESKEAEPPPLSTPEDLLDLWSVANGQGSREAACPYNLKLECSDLTANREVITFTSSASQILYMLDASNAALTISRSHPLSPTTTIQIAAPTLTEPSPTNPLVAIIFPKLAGLMALDQSSAIALNHEFERQTCADLQTEAVERACAREASSLFWDTDSQRYYLIHPTLAGGEPATFPIVSTTSQISILAPGTGAEDPVVKVSLHTLVLTIHTLKLTNLPSLYILDTLLSAILTLLLHSHRSSPTPSLLDVATPNTPISFPPPPSKALDLSSPHQTVLPYRKRLWRIPSLPAFPRRVKSKARRLPDSQVVADEESSLPVHPYASGSTIHAPFSPLAPPLMSEFQIFDPTDKQLPGVTRALLKLLYWSFSVAVWALGVVMQVLAAGLVGAGKLLRKL